MSLGLAPTECNQATSLAWGLSEVAASWENSGLGFCNPGFCLIRTQGNKLVTDHIEQDSVD